jgi:hypothetical protein
MKLKSLNLNRIFKQILPSVFFIFHFSFYAFVSRDLVVNIISIAISLLILGNLFLQNNIINLIVGIVFLLCYIFSLMLLTGVVYEIVFVYAEKTIFDYLDSLIIRLVSITMSLLLIWGAMERKVRKQF